MKTRTFLFSFFALFFISYGQSQSTTLPMENAIWCYTGYGDFGSFEGVACFSPDSLVEVNDQTYAHILHKTHPWANYQEILYREDEGKVFIIPQDSVNEILIYDFQLELGDTFLVTWGGGTSNGNFEVEVTNLDTVITLDGVERKRFLLQNPNSGHWAEWVEGIGDTEWPFLAPPYLKSLSGGYSLRCVESDGIPIYPTNYQANACITSVNEVISEFPDITIFPNPSDGDFTIKNEGQVSFHLQVFDQLGRLILENNESNRHDSFQIPKDYGQGIYLVKIIFEDQGILFKRVMKN